MFASIAIKSKGDSKDLSICICTCDDSIITERKEYVINTRTIWYVKMSDDKKRSVCYKEPYHHAKNTPISKLIDIEKFLNDTIKYKRHILFDNVESIMLFACMSQTILGRNILEQFHPVSVYDTTLDSKCANNSDAEGIDTNTRAIDIYRIYYNWHTGKYSTKP